MSKKLSSVQASVIEALRKKNARLIESRLYHWSKVKQKDKTLILSVHKPTVTFLKKNNFIILVEGSKNEYALSPDWSFSKKKPYLLMSNKAIMTKELELFYLPSFTSRSGDDIKSRVILVDFNIPIKMKDVIFHPKGGLGWVDTLRKASYCLNINPYLEKAQKMWPNPSGLNDYFNGMQVHEVPDGGNYLGQGVVIASNPQITQVNPFHIESENKDPLYNKTLILGKPEEGGRPSSAIIEIDENGKPKHVNGVVVIKEWVYPNSH